VSARLLDDVAAPGRHRRKQLATAALLRSKHGHACCLAFSSSVLRQCLLAKAVDGTCLSGYNPCNLQLLEPSDLLVNWCVPGGCLGADDEFLHVPLVRVGDDAGNGLFARCSSASDPWP
jgi:hypothetical protein